MGKQYLAEMGFLRDDYLYWSDVKYKKLPECITHTELWAAVKVSRMLQRIFQWERYGITVTMTNHMQQLCHEFDMNFGGSWGNNSIIPGENKEQYLISSLMEEAISSSQMEGATTTRKVAKDMLRKNTAPKNRSEQMIYNNYNSIRFIVEHKSEPLTAELLLKVHSLMTYNTLEDSSDEGRFREDDGIVVENGITHEIVHTPPKHEDITDFVEELCDFFNGNQSKGFIHPIVKAVIIHFMVAYVHPFVDGNGRMGRLLISLFLTEKGLLSKPCFYMSAYLQEHREEYYTALGEISRTGCWERWIRFFITAILERSRANITILREMTALYEECKKKLHDCTSSGYAINILDYAFENPIFTVPTMAKTLQVSVPALFHLIQKLQQAGFFQCVRKGSGRQAALWSFGHMMDILQR